MVVKEEVADMESDLELDVGLDEVPGDWVLVVWRTLGTEILQQVGSMRVKSVKSD